MKTKRYLYFLLAAPLLTLLAIWSHTLLPVRSLPLINADTRDLYLYADETSGGNSTVQWLDKDKGAWLCQLRKGEKFPYCGMSLLTTGDHSKGIDLSNFNAVKLWIGYRGPAKKIRVYLRNYDPEINAVNDLDAGKFISVQLNTADLDKQVVLSLDEFSVADWWVDRYSVPRKLAQPSFENIVNIGIDFANPYPFGDHTVTVRNIEFTGEWILAERWYLAIIALWVIGFLVFASWRWYHFYRHSLKNTRRIAELASVNEQLLNKKEEYKYLSKTDPLTGALNRFGFTQVVENVLDNRKPEEPVALVLFSVDQFKRVKDILGLNETDQFLQQVAAVIADNTRDHHVLSRWEGEEFVLLCPDTLCSTAYIMAENVRKILSGMVVSETRNSSITISAGIAEISPDESFASAFKKIDDAIFKARTIGGNCTIMG